MESELVLGLNPKTGHYWVFVSAVSRSKVELDLFFFFASHCDFASSRLLQLEKQIHEDEEFARTLAMLDQEPQAKKVI